MKKYLFIPLFICLMLTACVTSSEASSETIMPPTGSWKLISYGPITSPSSVDSNVESTLIFGENGKLSGNGGCNQLMGSYEVKGEQITFGPISSTRKRCSDPVMVQEGIVLKVLTVSVSFKVEGNILTITNNDLVLVLEAV